MQIASADTHPVYVELDCAPFSDVELRLRTLLATGPRQASNRLSGHPSCGCRTRPCPIFGCRTTTQPQHTARPRRRAAVVRAWNRTSTKGPDSANVDLLDGRSLASDVIDGEHIWATSGVACWPPQSDS